MRVRMDIYQIQRKWEKDGEKVEETEERELTYKLDSVMKREKNEMGEILRELERNEKKSKCENTKEIHVVL